MVSGGVDKEKLQLNEKTLWTGGPGSAGYNFGNRLRHPLGAPHRCASGCAPVLTSASQDELHPRVGTHIGVDDRRLASP